MKFPFLFYFLGLALFHNCRMKEKTKPDLSKNANKQQVLCNPRGPEPQTSQVAREPLAAASAVSVNLSTPYVASETAETIKRPVIDVMIQQNIEGLHRSNATVNNSNLFVYIQISDFELAF